MEGYISNLAVEASFGGRMTITVVVHVQGPDRSFALYTYVGMPDHFDIVSEILSEWWFHAELVDTDDIDDLLNDRHLGVDEP